MSGDPAQDYFVDGLVEDIITNLSHFRELFVVARNSTFPHRGQSVDVQPGLETGLALRSMRLFAEAVAPALIRSRMADSGSAGFDPCPTGVTKAAVVPGAAGRP